MSWQLSQIKSLRYFKVKRIHPVIVTIVFLTVLIEDLSNYLQHLPDVIWFPHQAYGSEFDDLAGRATGGESQA